MSLKVKLFLAFLSTTVASLAIAGVLALQNARENVVTRVVDRLEAIANIQEQRVGEAANRYLEWTNLVASRTQLRLSTAELAETAAPSTQALITRIIKDAQLSLPEIYRISIINTQGTIIASTEAGLVGESRAGSNHFLQGQQAPVLEGLFSDEFHRLNALLAGPMLLDGSLIGVVEMVASVTPFLQVTSDYTGLGKTGEALLAQRNEVGDALYLTPLRFDGRAALQKTVSREELGNAVVPAVYGLEGLFMGAETTDYRSQPIIAVTRYINEIDWGLVVKIDEAEALTPVRDLESSFLIILALVVFVVAADSYVIARLVTRPITELTKVAGRLRTGDLSHRAKARGQDEVGRLASAFNAMLDKLKASHEDLEKKVRERTRELRHAKAKDDAILASIGDGLAFTDMGGRVLLVNRAAELMLGWSIQDLVGHKWLEVTKTVDGRGQGVPKAKLPLSQALATGQTSVTTTSSSYYYTRKDGTSFPVAITAAPVLIGTEIIGGIIVFRDITLEKDIDRAKTEFVSLASHQLRTPLSAISWYSEMLLDGDQGKLSEGQEKYLHQIYSGNQRMIELVNALLNVSRIELGTFVVEPEPTDVVTLLERILDECQPQIKDKQLKISFVPTKDIPTLSADPKLLEMVYQNLISNAIKYTPAKGSITVRMKVTRQGEELAGQVAREDSVLVTVADTGYGIPKDQQTKVFEKLFRADNVKTRDTEGTGLGLYLVKSIVEHSGGRVWFTSAEDKGTTFYFTLPLRGMKVKKGSKRLG